MTRFGVSRRFAFTIIVLLLILAVGGLAIFFAKGYRFSTEQGTFTGTGIMSITSIPDQASVYLDGHLTTATNANINSLVPKIYKVKIVKEGFIAWEKDIEVKEGFVSEVKATLFPAIPTIYPLTYNGVFNPVLSPDNQKLVFVVPGTDKKSGIWVWTMSERPIAFARGGEPHQIATPASGYDFTKATFRWSPDTTQILVTLPDRTLLLDETSLNDTPRDITAIQQATIRGWDDEVKTKELARVDNIPDLDLKNIASSSASLKWSPDETKFIYSDQVVAEDEQLQATDSAKARAPKPKIKYKVADITEKETFELPEAEYVKWLPDSRHLILVDEGKISVVEYDGGNLAAIYAGTFETRSVFPWPDGSRLMFVSSFPIPTAQQPNLFGINLK